MYYNEFCKMILSKAIDFIEKYGAVPKYVKVPLYYSDGLFDSNDNILHLSSFIKICGLKLCETETITKLEDCEVF